MIALLLIACTPPEPTGDDRQGLLGRGVLEPFPTIHAMSGDHVAIPEHLLPYTPTDVPVDRIAFRTGFSPAQTSVVTLEGVDPSALPSWRSPVPGEGGVLLVDLTDGRFLSVMAELDAWPEAPEPALLIRPQEAIPYGHRAAVVVMTTAAPRPERFDALVSGDPPADFAHREAHYVGLLDELEALGVARDEVALAWDFPVGDGTTPLRSALAQRDAPPDWQFTRIRELEAGDDVAPLAWRVAQGRFTATSFLVDDVALDLNPDGTVNPTGAAQADVYVHIPTSVKDAPAGSVPVMFVGHGIFASIEDSLDINGESAWTRAAEDGGFILVGTNWRGLDWDDRAGVVGVSQDFGTVSNLTDRLVQGQVQTRTLVDLVANDVITQDPVFRGAQGQPLVDPEHLVFFGASLGSIQGAVLMAGDPPIDRALLHIGGAVWSTMLERSRNWETFELFMVDAVEDPTERQLLYSVAQLFFDVSDPIAYTAELRERSLVLQENREDDSVSNLGAETLGRSIGWPVLAPSTSEPVGFEEVDGPLPVGASALVQLDTKKAKAGDKNRPSKYTGAHEATWMWPGTRAQQLEFFTEGTISHHCADAPCAPGNTGSYP